VKGAFDRLSVHRLVKFSEKNAQQLASTQLLLSFKQQESKTVDKSSLLYRFHKKEEKLSRPINKLIISSKKEEIDPSISNQIEAFAEKLASSARTNSTSTSSSSSNAVSDSADIPFTLLVDSVRYDNLNFVTINPQWSQGKVKKFPVQAFVDIQH
jgi:hypothetical protein